MPNADKALAPDLKSVTDLSRYKDVFRDPEDPPWPRSSIARPLTRRSSTAKTQGLWPDRQLRQLPHGSGAALDAEVASSIRRGKPVLFYYWSPTPCAGPFSN